uniref:Mating-type protein phb2 n=1 Tax=Hypsizygus marmoreus TaxID=39966 RepID=A0A7T7DKG8_HYPMA|nr:mating-type protein phb2 [Hypsizygus marmoreus]
MDSFTSFESLFATLEDSNSHIQSQSATIGDSNPPSDQERYDSGSYNAFCTIS